MSLLGKGGTRGSFLLRARFLIRTDLTQIIRALVDRLREVYQPDAETLCSRVVETLRSAGKADAEKSRKPSDLEYECL